MNLLASSTYSAAARSITELRNLRKVKLFPRVSTVTVVTYYRRVNDTVDYSGKALIVDLAHMKAAIIEVIHNIHAPPADEETEANDEDVDPQPTQPAIGCQYLPV